MKINAILLLLAVVAAVLIILLLVNKENFDENISSSETKLCDYTCKAIKIDSASFIVKFANQSKNAQELVQILSRIGLTVEDAVKLLVGQNRIKAAISDGKNPIFDSLESDTTKRDKLLTELKAAITKKPLDYQEDVLNLFFTK